MRAIQFETPGRLREIDIGDAPSPGPGDALVKVHRVGICGTDYAGYLGKMPFFSYPRIFGHELGVEVIAVGEGVTGVAPGDHCSVEPYLNCRTCSACRRGHTNCCESNQTLGVHCDGGMRPRFIVPARKLHRSRKLSFEQLALVETLAIGCHAVNRARVQEGESVVIIGAGPIGLSALEFVKLAGARSIVMDVHAGRLEFARSVMGAEHTVEAKGDGKEEEGIRTAAGGEWPPVVIDATGSNRSMSQAMNYTAFAGRLVYVGITMQEIAVPHPLMHRRELSLLASRNAVAPEFARIIELIESERIDTNPWISHRAGFDELIGEFPGWVKPETGVIKAMVAVE
jgi:alcohol dehydrogenase